MLGQDILVIRHIIVTFALVIIQHGDGTTGYRELHTGNASGPSIMRRIVFFAYNYIEIERPDIKHGSEKSQIENVKSRT